LWICVVLWYSIDYNLTTAVLGRLRKCLFLNGFGSHLVVDTFLFFGQMEWDDVMGFRAVLGTTGTSLDSGDFN